MAIILLAMLLIAVLLGFELVVAILLVSVLAIYMTVGDATMTISFISSTAYESLREYVFAVIPLFLIMGELIARSGAAQDMFAIVDRRMKRLRGRIAYATVVGNVIFAFVTGSSVASATAFARIAYPQMVQMGYNRPFSLGLIAGSACIGLLIPPSIPMIVWALLTEISIRDIFLAGVIPGLILAVGIGGYIFATSIFRPDYVGVGPEQEAARKLGSDPAAPILPADMEAVDRKGVLISLLGFLTIVLGVIGGIWFGLFTPTEGAAFGVLVSLGVALLKGMSWRDIYDAILAVGKTAAPLMAIVFAAQLFSRALALSGVTNTIEQSLGMAQLDPTTIMIAMIVVWLILGMFLDTISILLLTVPIFHPLAVANNIDPIAFAMIGILAVEIGLLTPPFGINIFAVKSAVEDRNVRTSEIFRGAFPMWCILMALIVMLLTFPVLATYLPSL